MTDTDSARITGRRPFEFKQWHLYLIILAANLLLALTYPQKILYGDAVEYWAESRSFIVGGHFSLLNWAQVYHGYFLPLLLQVPIQIAGLTGLDEILVFRVLSAIAATFCIAWLFPKCFEELFNFRAKPLETLVFAALIMFFWYGWFAYPLTDFPALAFFMAGLALCIKVLKSDRPLWFKAVLLCVSGMCLAAASIIRILYFLPSVLLFCFIVIRVVRGSFTTAGKIMLAGCMLAGSLIVFTPQALSNKIHYDVYSILPQSRIQNTHISLLQAYYGLTTQRFESAIEKDKSVAFTVPDEQGLMLKKKYFSENITLSKGIEMAVRQPFDVAAIYVRHVFNGIDVVYPVPYINDLYTNQLLYRLLNYTLWFLAIMVLWKRGIDIKRDAEVLLFVFLLLLPALVSIPVQIEPRFFLPAYILMYGCMAYWFICRRDSWKQMLTFRNAILYVCFMAACFAFSSYLFATAGILLIN